VVESLLDENIVEVCGGFQHTLFRTESGNVYGTGRSQYCSFGTVPVSQVKIFGYVNSPMLVDIDKVASIAAGHFHSLFLTDTGEVYACGKNDNGQCGQVYKKDVVQNPIKIYFPEPITQVACGLKHSVALGQSGTLYAWGCKIYGQVDGFRGGMDEEQCSPLAIRIPSKFKVTEIYAAFNRTAAKLESGEVWVWGGEDHRNLGGEYYETMTLLNEELPEGKDEEIFKIGLGYMHTVIASIT
jgi:alpha-tubulin suppressor-like RCC1 family protein